MASGNQPFSEEEPADVAADRARELLHFSSSSVESELERAKGWLNSARLFKRQSAYWEVEVITGALGSLANAWGRLTLWARANGSYDQVQGDLESSMDRLLEMHHHIISGKPALQDETGLEGVLELLEQVFQRVQSNEPA